MSEQLSEANLIRLETAIQQYPWGKKGSSSLVAQLAPNSAGPEFTLDEETPYAEIWMGTHPNGPLRLFNTAAPLETLIKGDRTSYLGQRISSKWPDSTQLPYLFKVLSIASALPLQAHPDKLLAEALHQRDPKSFVDANHKPEIAVAIGAPLPGYTGEDKGVAFTGFVGFQPLEDIRHSLQTVPELWRAVGDYALVDNFITAPSKELLKRVYTALIMRPKDAMEKEVRSLVRRIRDSVKRGYGDDAALGRGKDAEEKEKLVDKIEKQYPGDVGALATVFFMNFVKLKRGESVYIGADEVHAYLEGDIIECMAVSDNVLNAAFIPQPPPEDKWQVRAFLDALTYTARPISHWILPSSPFSRSRTGRTVLYAPPEEEFSVLGTTLSSRAGEDTEELAAVAGPLVGIVTRGEVSFTVGKEEEAYPRGAVVFVRPGNAVQLRLIQGQKARPEEGDQPEGEVWWAVCLV